MAMRGMSPSLTYIIVSTLQILPQMRNKANTIIDAQRSRGLETQGSLRRSTGAPEAIMCVMEVELGRSRNTTESTAMAWIGPAS
jgi:energy-coupling factor transporter transmembrane protein EcfT